MIFRIQVKDCNLHESVTREALEAVGDDASESKRDYAVEMLQTFMEQFTRYGEYLTLEFDTDIKVGRVMPMSGNADREMRKVLAGAAYEAIEEWNEEEEHGLQTDWMIELAVRIANKIMDPPEDQEIEEPWGG